MQGPDPLSRPDASIGPLTGTVVLDLSRMVPGAALARQLIGLGARVIKIEDPRGGDPMRHMAPFKDGVGAGFAAYYAGAESVALDLKDPQGAQSLLELATRADVLVESFRPGTMAAWGLGPQTLLERNKGLVVCSLPGFAGPGPLADRVGHDLNFTALTGLLNSLGRPADGSLPRVQLADVTCGLLACSAILAALLERSRTGCGQHVQQSLLGGAAAFMTWLYADCQAGSPGAPETLLAGHCPAYGLYTCADGLELAVAAVEPKFWQRFVELLELPGLAPWGLDMGPTGQDARAELARTLSSKPRSHWLDLIASSDLPITPVNLISEALGDPTLAPLLTRATSENPALASAPPLGRDTARILEEFAGISIAGDP